jgi:hypothetical protein
LTATIEPTTATSAALHQGDWIQFIRLLLFLERTEGTE